MGILLQWHALTGQKDGTENNYCELASLLMPRPRKMYLTGANFYCLQPASKGTMSGERPANRRRAAKLECTLFSFWPDILAK